MEKRNFKGAGYQTPDLQVIEVNVEGVLCMSGEIDGSGEDNI